MGAWETGVFDNDSALDWLDDILESGSLTRVLLPLKQTINSRRKTIFGRNKNKYIEEPLGSECLAAAEVIATSIGRPGHTIPVQLIDWVEAKRMQLDTKTIELAARAVIIIKTDSELKELWEESEYYCQWLETVNDLEKR
ncbi:MAG: DUF4259 domain-containing protein [Deltaproteobacteria bacterium]